MAEYLGCLYSIVKNTSSDSRFFGFLPPHGRTLAADEELHILGNVYDAIYRNGTKGLRQLEALETAIADGDLTIVTSPCTIAYDAVDAASYRVGVKNGSVIASEPSFDSDTYTSVTP